MCEEAQMQPGSEYQPRERRKELATLKPSRAGVQEWISFASGHKVRFSHYLLER